MATLILNDGKKFHGSPFGYNKNTSGEIVFQTGMVGYVESLTDPSYFGQILVMTYPLIGNYGIPDVNKVDEFGIPEFVESNKIWISGLVVSSCSQNGQENHYLSTKSLDMWMKEHKIIGIQGVDTRSLTKYLRDKGTMSGKIVLDCDINTYKIENFNLSISKRFQEIKKMDKIKIYKNLNVKSFNVIAVDCGMKNSQIRYLIQNGFIVTKVPFNYDFTQDILTGKYCALYLSNGPGDPEDYIELINNVRKLLQKKIKIPIMGICLGNQILSIAAGFSTYKMKYGNRGHNQPCIDSICNTCVITSQNHGYAVDLSKNSFGNCELSNWNILYENINDKSVEGIYHKTLPYFAVQFHPEHSAGPKGSEFLFNVFSSLTEKFKNIKNDIYPKFDEIFTNYIKSNTFFTNNNLSITNWCEENLTMTNKYRKRVLILGSGGLCIGQAGEFDYSGSQAIKALKEENIYTILINPNIATVQTTRGLADSVYLVPVNVECVEQVIELERPDGILLSFGGQTALNCGLELEKLGILNKYNVKVLGTNVETIKWTEDRKIFSDKMKEINEPVAPSLIATNIEQALNSGEQLGYPVMIRSAFTLGGKGSGFANDKKQLEYLSSVALQSTSQIIIDKSLTGWKEIEYEVVRDIQDNCLTVCNMENIDPLGIHTGESIVVAPTQTLTDKEYHLLRAVAIKVVRHLQIVGECNIQYALDPNSNKYYIIEVNARLSRSSALASKATGYPLAYVGAKLALGFTLPKLANAVTSGSIGNVELWTSACFEPSLDYIVLKMPRWDMNKFTKVSNKIGTSMKSVGEVMAIGRTFEEAIQKAIRMVDVGMTGFNGIGYKCNDNELKYPSDRRIFYLAAAMEANQSIDYIYELTKIDKWFLYKMYNIIKCAKEAEKLIPFYINNVDMKIINKIKEMKKIGFSDIQLGTIFQCTQSVIRDFRLKYGIIPKIRQIDTVAGEYPATTNYLYLTYNSDENDIIYDELNSKKSIIVLGSGVYRIGSSVEFDCCSVSCIKELKLNGWKPIMINFNPETVSTDYDECEKLYFDEISLEVVLDIYMFEKPYGVIISMGGQLPNNIAMDLHRLGVNILGTSPEMIDMAENRFKFSRLLDTINIKQPKWKELTTYDEAKEFCNQVGYPCLVRPSYVLSGAGMSVVMNDNELSLFLSNAVMVSRDYPVVISKFILNAKEIDVDAVASNGKIICIAISEHVENAGTHSGDASLILPSQNLNKETLDEIHRIAYGISVALNVSGPFNLQLIATNNQLKVIECNLRVSRSFPFVSKVLNCDFMAIATKVALEKDLKPIKIDYSKLNVGVKVPQFSFPQLSQADVKLGVEMASTGEVACFGKNVYEAYLKALIATGFKIPKNKNLFVSIGPYKVKNDLIESLLQFHKLGFTIFGSKGSTDFFLEHNIPIKAGIFSLEDLSDANDISDINTRKEGGRRVFYQSLFDVKKFFLDNKIDLIINIPMNACSRSDNNIATLGYQIRRAAIDYSIPLITEKNNVRMLIQALLEYKGLITVDPTIDTILSGNILRLPGLIDVHVHMREPGDEHKEDFLTGTRAALMGGITCVLCMPNTKPSIIDNKSLLKVRELAKEKALCDYGFYIGATENNVENVNDQLVLQSFGMKMYLNDTYSQLKLTSFECWVKHFENWNIDMKVPILCHSEGSSLAAILYLVSIYKKPVHICHVSKKEEILLIKNAKEKGLPVTCEVTPHHLFLTSLSLNDKNGRHLVKPSLNTEEDRKALWENLEYIDCFATDHAPHLLIEKDSNINPPPGFPGVETMLPLLFKGVKEGKLTIDDIVKRLHDNPIKIFNMKKQPNTFVDIEIGPEYILKSEEQYTKAGWTPFDGIKVDAKVLRVFIRGKMVMVAGKTFVDPGFGIDAKEWDNFDLTINKNLNELNLNNKLYEKNKNIILQQQYKFTIEPTDTDFERCSVNRIYQLLNSNENDAFKMKSFLSTESCTRNQLRFLFSLASEFQKLVDLNLYVPPILQGKIVSLSFFENSTRTMLSFESAIKRLGGNVFHFRPSDSSMSKGETFEDTLQVLSSFADAIVLRHPKIGTAKKASLLINIPIINAGDGSGEHPSQSLLDCFTIREEIGTINKLVIAFVGDLKYSRTVHSLAKLLCQYKCLCLYYVSPLELSMPKEIIDYVSTHSDIKQVHFTSLDEIISKCDVLYMTRIQKERFDTFEEYKKYQGCYKIDLNLLSKAKSNMKILHPLPRVDEISEEVDSDNRAAYFRQVKYGMYTRMALMASILFDENKKSFLKF